MAYYFGLLGFSGISNSKTFITVVYWLSVLDHGHHGVLLAARAGHGHRGSVLAERMLKDWYLVLNSFAPLLLSDLSIRHDEDYVCSACHRVILLVLRLKANSLLGSLRCLGVSFGLDVRRLSSS